jgi:hypothetical protein
VPRCESCGSGLAAQRAAQAARERAAAEAAERASVTNTFAAIFCLEFIAVQLLGAAVWVFFAFGRQEVRDVAFAVGGTFLGIVAFIQAVAYGIHKGQSWARLAGMALLVLSVPSCALPVAVIGLIVLANGRAWAAYVARRTTTAKGVEQGAGASPPTPSSEANVSAPPGSFPADAERLPPA